MAKQVPTAARKELGEPDPFRFRYRNEIREIVVTIVHGCMDKPQAIAEIRKYAQKVLSPKDQARFIEIAENELLSLHEGNIARYRIRPAEFEKWQQIWKK